MDAAVVCFLAAALLERTDLCKGTAARDAEGRIVDWSSPRAAAFCATGAVSRIIDSPTMTPTHTIVYVTIRAVIDPLHPSRVSIPKWNDEPERTAPEVVSALRRAGELLRAQESADGSLPVVP